MRNALIGECITPARLIPGCQNWLSRAGYSAKTKDRQTGDKVSLTTSVQVDRSGLTQDKPSRPYTQQSRRHSQADQRPNAEGFKGHG